MQLIYNCIKKKFEKKIISWKIFYIGQIFCNSYRKFWKKILKIKDYYIFIKLVYIYKCMKFHSNRISISWFILRSKCFSYLFHVKFYMSHMLLCNRHPRPLNLRKSKKKNGIPLHMDSRLMMPKRSQFQKIQPFMNHLTVQCEVICIGIVVSCC